MLSAGCAIGCGNVWKFPWMTGENGGGSFVLLYILFLILLGLPTMTMEFAMGRAAQASVTGMYKKLQKPGSKWNIHGFFALAGNIALMCFYTVVTGWMIYYFIKFVTGKSSGLGFVTMISNPFVNIVYMLIAVIIGYGILCFKLQGGLERVTKYLMVVLLILILVLCVHSLFLPGAKEGLSFYLIPDFSKINGNVIVSAMNQAFFSLSIGIGAMAIFGSYIGKDRSLLGESVNVILLDTFVAIMAGFIIFPACFSFDIEVNSGPSLLFDTMANVFNNMKGGRIWGSLFFLFMVFAALSTELGVFEGILASVRELTGWKRPVGCIVCATVISILSLTTALGYSVFRFQPFGKGSAWLDFWDFIVSTHLLPLGAFVFSIFCCNKFGWGWDNFVAEANSGKGLKIQKWMKPVFQYAVPFLILCLYIYGLITYDWK
ncbi:MAG: sodium-dependent transporter [Lachnospiraceae bacterium]|nr:sodium-dependent transporter [Lachnospiraceae bacterium]